jgi:hypothetical protein
MTDASEIATGPGETMGNAGPGMLDGVRVIEIADERAEYTGLVNGWPRRRGHQDRAAGGQCDKADRTISGRQAGTGSLAVFLALQSQQEIRCAGLAGKPGQERLLRLLEGADVLLDSSCGAVNAAARSGSRGDREAVSETGHRAHDAVRR